MKTSLAIPLKQRIDRLHRGGLIDMHFDLPLGLYWNRSRRGVVRRDFLRQFRAANTLLLGVALYVEDTDLSQALQVALDQVALLREEIERTPELMLCRSFAEIQRARAARRIGMLLTMEGAEPLGKDLHLLRVFYDLGLRAISLTHARENAAAAGGIFAPTGSPRHGLTAFGRDLVRECERLGIMIDLAHINPAGFEEIVRLTKKPLIVSHSNARRFFDIERNMTDEQIKMIGRRGGVIGINAILVSPTKEEATLDRYVDHIEHVADLIGIDGVGIGFDFCQFLWRQMPRTVRDDLETKLTVPHFLPDLDNHGDARKVTAKLIERGFTNAEIEKFLRGNWLRVLKQLL
jgi:membrane dipeptidase